MKFVQFSDSGQTSIISVFASDQDPEVYPNLGIVEEQDPRYQAYLLIGKQDQSEINRSERDRRLAAATLAIAPLQDALDLEIATDEERLLLAHWKQYRVAVNRVDIADPHLTWPDPPRQI